jgi:hypothetical protein
LRLDAHFGRPTPVKPAVIGLASERRLSCAQFGSPKATDTNPAASLQLTTPPALTSPIKKRHSS